MGLEVQRCKQGAREGEGEMVGNSWWATRSASCIRLAERVGHLPAWWATRSASCSDSRSESATFQLAPRVASDSRSESATFQLAPRVASDSRSESATFQ